MTQITEEFTVDELKLCIRFSRLCTQMDITVVPENLEDIMLEVARKSPTDTLLAMIAGYKEIPVPGPSKEMVEIIINELKTRGVLEK